MLTRKFYFKKVFLKLACLGICLSSLSVFAASSVDEQMASNLQPATITKNTTASIPTEQMWNFQDADLMSVIQAVSNQTGKNFLVDPNVKGKVTLVSNHPLKAEEVYPVFLSVLQVQGYIAIPAGNVTKIIADQNALQQPLALQSAGSASDELVVQVLAVKNIPTAQLLPSLQPLLGRLTNVSLYGPTNTLIISGPSDKVKSLVSVIEQVDKSNPHGIDIVTLQYAAATDLVDTINNLQTATGLDRSMQLAMAADERTNSILLRGSFLERLRTRLLINKLDQPSSQGDTTQVFYLHYLKAKDFSVVLSKIIQSQLNQELGITAAKPVAGAGSTVSVDVNTNQSKISVVAETNTNSVVVSAPAAMMRRISKVIHQLDVRPAQVLVEAIIAEVDESTLERLGIEWGMVVNDPSMNSSPFTTADSTVVGDIGQIAANTLSTGLPTGFQPYLGVIRKGDFRAIVRVLANSGSTNILSTPSLVVLNNHKAVIKVGTKLPTTTGSYANAGVSGTVTPFNTFSDKNVGLHLNVMPQINQGNSVQLTIDQGNEAETEKTGVGGNPITNYSAINTSVLVNSGEILVLGGLISHDVTKGETKIPLLGDIPIVGTAFRTESNTVEKKSLMVFLRPVILRGKQDNSQVTDPRYELIRQLQLEQVEHPTVHALSRVSPVLPSPKATLPQPFEDH